MSKKSSVRGRWQAGWTTLAAALLCAGCSSPVVEGYQVQEPPVGFFFTEEDPETRATQREPRVVDRGTWFGDVFSGEPRSFIRVTRWDGAANAPDAAAMRERRASEVAGTPSVRLGGIEEMRVDGRPAWGWLETRYDDSGEVRALEYTMLVGYDDEHFTVEFATEARARLDPDELRAVVSSFAEGRTVVYWKTILAGLVVLFAIPLYLQSRAKRTPPRYRLPDYPVGSDLDAVSDEDEKKVAGAAASATAQREPSAREIEARIAQSSEGEFVSEIELADVRPLDEDEGEGGEDEEGGADRGVTPDRESRSSDG